MPTLAEVAATLGESIIEMVRIFANDVALYDPLSSVSLVAGTLLIVVSSAIFGGLVLGAVGELLGVGSTR